MPTYQLRAALYLIQSRGGLRTLCFCIPGGDTIACLKRLSSSFSSLASSLTSPARISFDRITMCEHASILTMLRFVTVLPSYALTASISAVSLLLPPVGTYLEAPFSHCVQQHLCCPPTPLHHFLSNPFSSKFHVQHSYRATGGHLPKNVYW